MPMVVSAFMSRGRTHVREGNQSDHIFFPEAERDQNSHMVVNHPAKSSVSLSNGAAEELGGSREQADACQEAVMREQMALCGRRLDRTPHPSLG